MFLLISLAVLAVFVLIIRGFGFKWQTWVALILLFMFAVSMENDFGFFVLAVGAPIAICINYHVKKQCWKGIYVHAAAILVWAIYVIYNMLRDFLAGGY